MVRKMSDPIDTSTAEGQKLWTDLCNKAFRNLPSDTLVTFDDVSAILTWVLPEYDHICEMAADCKPSTMNFTVQKVTSYIPVSTELALDYGLITEEKARAQGWTPAPKIHIPWYRKLRWRFQSLRERLGRRVGSWLAGVDLSEPTE